MDEQEHYDIALRKSDSGFEAVLKLNIGDIKHVQKAVPIMTNSAKLVVEMNNFFYKFIVCDGDKRFDLGIGQTKYLSSEVASGFTGVIIGLYAQRNNTAKFSDFKVEYK